MNIISTRYLKKGKEPSFGNFGALIQTILPDEEYYPIIGSLKMVAELKNFNGFEGSLYENKNVLYGDGKLLGRKFSVLGETDFNKQDIIKISMTAIGRKEFAYNWRQHSNFFEVDIGITDEDFLKLRDNLFKEENVTTYITLIFKETGHFYESKNNDIAILRYPQDLENKEELPESFKVFNEKNEKELFGHEFRFSFGYSQKKDDILPKDKEEKPKSIFKRIFGI